MDDNSGQRFAWHYTTGENFRLIVESGVLLPTAVGIGKHEKPVIWFSVAEFWEPTAAKMMLQSGQLVDQGMEGTYKHGGGLARFGLAVSKLVPWPKLARKANIHPSDRVRLEAVARRQGSVPTHWYGLIHEPLPLADVDAVEIYSDKQWVRIDHRPKSYIAKAGE